jgi:DNA-binding response OmpR family regulator
MRVLVIEDDADVRELVRIVLREEGHAVDEADTIAEGGLLARTTDYDAIVLDLRLPDGHGMQLARQLRAERRGTPILMLTAQRSTAEKVAGLDAGADDYLCKPFETAELKARVRALARRRPLSRPDDQLVIGDLLVNRLARKALVLGEPLTLTAKEFTMLEQLALHAEEVLTRTQLLEQVWERNRDPDSNVIDVHVGRLRAKLQAAGGRARIVTVRGVGFMLTNAPPSPTA